MGKQEILSATSEVLFDQDGTIPGFETNPCASAYLNPLELL